MATTLIVVQHGEKAAVPGDPGLTTLGHRQASTTPDALAAAAAVTAPTGPIGATRPVPHRSKYEHLDVANGPFP